MKTAEQLQIEDAERRALQEAISKIENMAGNTTYRAAWRKAVTALRELLLKRV